MAFTDDDAIPQPGWLQAAASRLRSNPALLGAVGHVTCPPYDPLFEHAVASDVIGAYLTCNVAYRRSALEQVGGFDQTFPTPHCEDRDLGHRIAMLGPVTFEPSMVVHHPARPATVRDIVRRARLITSDWRLHRKHPETRPPRWSVRWGPVVRTARHWQRLATEERVIAGSPRRGVRFATLALGQLGLAAWTAMTAWEDSPAAPSARPSGSRSRRIAYVGPVPNDEGGVAGVARQLIAGLVELGCHVDCFVSGIPTQISSELSSPPGVRVIQVDTGWRWDRWYSRHRMTKLVTGNLATAWGRRKVARALVAAHNDHPYDVVYQFSTIEIFGLRRWLTQLPPLVVHPGTHMAGELRWFRAERRLARRCESWHRLVTVDAFLAIRARRQRRDIRLADRVVAISEVFRTEMASDYDVVGPVFAMVPNPVDLGRFRPPGGATRGGPLRIGCVSRISTRKGIEVFVELSHRLSDLAGSVEMDLVGDHTLWSDYRPLLADLNPAVARYCGSIAHADLPAFYAGLDLLVHPAKYEPFGLTVAEALASGVPVATTAAVGAAENVSADCCSVTATGDIDALEMAIRTMLERVASDGAPALRETARAEAERLFSSGRVARLVLDVVDAAAADSPLDMPASDPQVLTLHDRQPIRPPIKARS